MYACPLVDEAILYSLRQLVTEEERAYEAHLSVCLTCRLKLSEMQETVDLMALATPPCPPPPTLKSKVLDRIASEASARPGNGKSESRRRRLVPIWAAAAVVALAVGSYTLKEIRDMRVELAALRQKAPQETSVAMRGTPAAPAATGRVIVARDANGARITLQAQGLPMLQPGEAYQLWLVKDGQRKNGGVFVVDATGKGGLATWLPEAGEFDTMGITKEPDALGLAPRGTKVMGSGA